MTYLLIAFIVFMALAPLSHFVPSRRQRRQAALRESAAVQGLFVEFRNLPTVSGATERVSHSGVIYYGLRLKPSRGRSRRRGAWRCEEGSWRPVGERLPVPEALQNLPPTVLAASVDEASCGVYWREEGEPSAVDEIGRALGDWAAGL